VSPLKNASSADVGTDPVLQLDAVDHSPVPAIQNTCMSAPK